MDDLVQLLEDKRSSKRRSAAKRLRKLRNPDAGPALLSALENEIQDKRTWETQYQMIMALGECGYQPAIPLLTMLKDEVFDATMVYVAIGDAMVRLSRPDVNDVSAVLKILKSGNSMLCDGALRAMAMLKLRPDSSDIDLILAHAKSSNVNDGAHIWILAAAPGWSGSEIDGYLDFCGQSERREILDAVALAREKKYKKWSPL